ncbi:MAG: alpha/beta hydrolase [Gemmataceae bacterium]
MTTLVLLHPFPFDSGLFQFQLDALKSVAHVVAIDLPGFGSEQPVSGISCNAMADRVIEACQARGIEQAVVGGVSMGGYVTLALARRHPQFVTGLILADTRAEPDDETARANRAKAIETVRTQGVSAFVDAQIPKVTGTTTQRENSDRIAWIRKVGQRQSQVGVISGIEMLRDRPDARPGLPSIKVPTLIVVGEEDVVTPLAAAQAMASSIASSTLVTIPRAGHLAHCERPDEFNAAVSEFLKTVG